MNLNVAIIALAPLGSIVIYHVLRGAVSAIRRLRAKQRSR